MYILHVPPSKQNFLPKAIYISQNFIFILHTVPSKNIFLIMTPTTNFFWIRTAFIQVFNL